MYYRGYGGSVSFYGEWGSYLMSVIVSCFGVI